MAIGRLSAWRWVLIEVNQKVEFDVTERLKGLQGGERAPQSVTIRKAVQRTRHERSGSLALGSAPPAAGPLKVDYGTRKRAGDTWDVLDPSDH